MARSTSCWRPRATRPTSATTRCSAASRRISWTWRGTGRWTCSWTTSRCATASSSADRLAASSPTLPLAELLLSKLQVVKINRKDVLDALVLLAEHPLGQDDGAADSRLGLGAINVPRILSFTSNDWGWWRTVTGNLDTLDQYLAVELDPEDLDLDNGRTVLFDPVDQVADAAERYRRRPEVDQVEAPRPGRRARAVVPGARGDGARD